MSSSWAWFVSWYSSTRRCASRPDGERDHVVEVDPRDAVEEPLVAPVDGRHLPLDEALGRGFEGVRGQQAVLGRADRGEHRARGVGLLRQALGLDRALDQAELVGGVEDREVALQADPLAVAAQEHEGEAMEGADEGRQREEAEEILHARAHLGRGLVGEGDGGDPFGGDPGLLGQPGDPVGDDPGLPRAGPGEDELVPLAMGDGGDLLGVEDGGEVEVRGALERARHRSASLSEARGGPQGGQSAGSGSV
jgi:hypothetical protein